MKPTTRVALGIGLLSALGAAAFLGWVIFGPTPELPKPPETLLVLDASGGELISLGPAGARDCRPLPLEQLGPMIVSATLAVEDRRYFHHPGVDPLAMARFLLTARVNGGDADAYGGALYELGLIPDFALFQDPAKTPQRLARNRDCVAKLTWSPKSERGRVLDLGLARSRQPQFESQQAEVIGSRRLVKIQHALFGQGAQDPESG